MQRAQAGALIFSAVVAGGLVISAVCPGASAAPAAKLIARWQANAPKSTIRVDHSAWGAFLKKYLKVRASGASLVAYGKVGGADKTALGRYLDRLSATPVSRLNRREQYAYWVNLYNALTVKTVLDAYPVISIKNIGGGIFSRGPWDDKRTSVEGVKLSLNDIEHGILRPIWRDARTHYALNCASIGCPSLPGVPFTPDNTQRLLNKAAFAYVNDTRGAAIKNGKLTVSSIYDWYKSDFGSTDAAVIRHLMGYAGPALKTRLAKFSKISGTHYNWSLNVAR